MESRSARKPCSQHVLRINPGTRLGTRGMMGSALIRERIRLCASNVDRRVCSSSPSVFPSLIGRAPSYHYSAIGSDSDLWTQHGCRRLVRVVQFLFPACVSVSVSLPSKVDFRYVATQPDGPHASGFSRWESEHHLEHRQA